MARPSQDKIDTFMRITGADESRAVRKLEEYGGNLDEAVNAHFSEVERHITNPQATASPQYDSVNARYRMQDGSRGILPLFSAARSFKPSLMFDPNYRRNLWNQIGSSVFPGHQPLHSSSGEFNNGYERPYHSGSMPAYEQKYGTSSHDHQFHGSVPRNNEVNLHGNDIEEQMVQSAIEASKQEELSGIQRLEDDELAHAISLSLKTAEQEKATREQQIIEDQKQLAVHASTGRTGRSDGGRNQPESSSFQGRAEDLQEHPLWGAISSKELDEVILLEEALFGQTVEETSYQHACQPPGTSDRSKKHCPQQACGSSSSSFLEQRLLREQQDDEYFASLLADRQKEMNIVKEPETSCVKKEGSSNKMLDEEAEYERLMAAKQASLPKEPAVNDDGAVTVLVRMPDGSRCSRRFFKSDKLRFLFDFIDVGRSVKPGTYRVVRPFPRSSFSTGDSSLTLQELGLTNKQEALFLELI